MDSPFAPGAGLGELYERAGEATAGFARRHGLSCPEACGSCCHGFMPDILEVEADYLARSLLASDPARAAAIAERGPGDAAGTCPLFRADSPFHCSAYEGRPLVCRLFGFAGTRDRLGAIRFRPCRHYPAGPVPDPDLAAPPLMSDFALLAEALSPGMAARAPLAVALPNALRGLLLGLRLRGVGD